MARRALCLVALLIGWASAPAARQQTITLPDGRQLTAVGGFTAEELALKLRELEDAANLRDPQERPARPANPQRTGTSRINGRIVNTNGSPLRDANVRVTAPGFDKTVTTDLNGRYEFRDLPAGRYRVLANKANYLGLAYGQLQPADLSRRVELGDNQAADATDITLPRGGVITGRVLDEFGEPVSDIQVVPVRKSLSQGQLRSIPTGRAGVTNDIGEYRIFGLQPGQYYVSVTPRPSGRPDPGADLRSGYAPTYYPGTPILASAAPITVGMNETIAGMDFPLVPARLATISGIAIDSQGAPVRTGSVSATDRNGNIGVSSGAPIRPDGTFTLTPLPPGEYVVRALLPPKPPPLPPGTPMPVPSGTLLGAMLALPPAETLVASVIVNGSDVTGVALTPLKRVNVSGRVVFDSPRGNRPSPAALRLSFISLSPEAGAAFEAPPRVNDDFTFQFSVPAMALAIRATSGSPDWVVKSIRMNGVDITDTGVDLHDSRDVSVEVELTSRPPEVSGSAVDAQGEAIKEYGVIVFPQDRDRWMIDSRLVATVRSGADGRYKVRTLPPGRYFAALVDTEQVSNLQDLDLEALVGRGTAFSLGEGEVVTVDLRLASGR